MLDKMEANREEMRTHKEHMQGKLPKINAKKD
jgi:hypothetical protein